MKQSPSTGTISMSFLKAFNNTTRFEDAFRWDDNDIKDFFELVRDHPGTYDVDQRSRISLANVVNTILQLITNHTHFLSQPMEVSYQGTTFLHETLFDLIGWLFSVTGTSPDYAERSNYYYPLVALYVQFCLLACDSNKRAPQIVQLTWFKQGNKVRAVLGANLDKPKPTTVKDDARGRRVNELVKRNLVQEAERNTSYVVTVTATGRISYKQLFGHCCETWPWLYMKSLNLSGTDRANAEGFAANSPRFTAMSSFVYDEGAITDSTADPCKNCEKLVERSGFTLQNFKKPTNIIVE